jgi:hypothetical protein
MELQAISGEIELTNLQCAVMPSKKDPDEIIICIPVKLNNLAFHKSKSATTGELVEDRSRIKLPFHCWPLKEENRKYSTHSIKQKWPKELEEKVKLENEGKDKADKVYAPSLGYASIIERGMGQSAQPSAAAQTIAQGCEDELPF